MKKIRAICIADIKYNICPVFELNKDTGWFEMLNDKSLKYEKESIYNNVDFLIFNVGHDDVKLVM